MRAITQLRVHAEDECASEQTTCRCGVCVCCLCVVHPPSAVLFRRGRLQPCDVDRRGASWCGMLSHMAVELSDEEFIQLRNALICAASSDADRHVDRHVRAAADLAMEIDRREGAARA